MIPFARTFLDLSEVGSTSDLAREMVVSGDPELPLVIRARRQSAGRGRGENKWWSDEGSLTFTIAIDPLWFQLRRDHEPRLALALAIEISEILELMTRTKDRLSIRWPNDLEVSGRKLAGLLPERVETPKGSRLLLGIGINVATDFAKAPEQVRRLAISANELSESPIDGDFLLEAILKRFGEFLNRLAADDPRFAHSWSSRDALYGHPVRLALGQQIVTGIGRGIDESGGLRIWTGSTETTYHSGQVLRGDA